MMWSRCLESGEAPAGESQCVNIMASKLARLFVKGSGRRLLLIGTGLAERDFEDGGAGLFPDICDLVIGIKTSYVLLDSLAWMREWPNTFFEFRWHGTLQTSIDITINVECVVLDERSQKESYMRREWPRNDNRQAGCLPVIVRWWKIRSHKPCLWYRGVLFVNRFNEGSWKFNYC